MVAELRLDKLLAVYGFRNSDKHALRGAVGKNYTVAVLLRVTIIFDHCSIILSLTSQVQCHRDLSR